MSCRFLMESHIQKSKAYVLFFLPRYEYWIGTELENFSNMQANERIVAIAAALITTFHE
jgi:hypothetical protein